MGSIPLLVPIVHLHLFLPSTVLFSLQLCIILFQANLACAVHQRPMTHISNLLYFFWIWRWHLGNELANDDSVRSLPIRQFIIRTSTILVYAAEYAIFESGDARRVLVARIFVC